MSIIRKSFRCHEYDEPAITFATIFCTIQTTTNGHHGENHKLFKNEAELYGRISRCEETIQ